MRNGQTKPVAVRRDLDLLALLSDLEFLKPGEQKKVSMIIFLRMVNMETLSGLTEVFSTFLKLPSL